MVFVVSWFDQVVVDAEMEKMKEEAKRDVTVTMGTGESTGCHCWLQPSEVDGFFWTNMWLLKIHRHKSNVRMRS